jgi:hypothetical protein
MCLLSNTFNKFLFIENVRNDGSFFKVKVANFFIKVFIS